MAEQESMATLLRAVTTIAWIVVICAISGMIYLAFGDAIGGHIFPKKGPAVQHQIADNLSMIDKDGLDVATGLVYARGFEAVRMNCTNCHSAKLITQNRASREGWHQMIRWMQQTQGLWELGSNEKLILDYLAEHYAPASVGRRAQLDPSQLDWYQLGPETQ